MHGLVHPEMGHVRIPHDLQRDPFVGSCPFHGDCLEGLASGPAMEARWGRAAQELPEGQPGWALEARYLALALVNLVCTLSPQRIVLGGGVMSRLSPFPSIRSEVVALLNDYVRAPQIVDLSTTTSCRLPLPVARARSARWRWRNAPSRRRWGAEANRPDAGPQQPRMASVPNRIATATSHLELGSCPSPGPRQPHGEQ